MRFIMLVLFAFTLPVLAEMPAMPQAPTPPTMPVAPTMPSAPAMPDFTKEMDAVKKAVEADAAANSGLESALENAVAAEGDKIKQESADFTAPAMPAAPTMPMEMPSAPAMPAPPAMPKF